MAWEGNDVTHIPKEDGRENGPTRPSLLGSSEHFLGQAVPIWKQDTVIGKYFKHSENLVRVTRFGSNKEYDGFKD